MDRELKGRIRPATTRRSFSTARDSVLAACVCAGLGLLAFAAWRLVHKAHDPSLKVYMDVARAMIGRAAPVADREPAARPAFDESDRPLMLPAPALLSEPPGGEGKMAAAAPVPETARPRRPTAHPPLPLTGVVIGSLGGGIDPQLSDPAAGPESIRLAFSVEPAASRALYVVSFQGMDLSESRNLVFDIKGEAGGEVFSLEYDDGSVTRELSITRILPRGIPAEWHTVVVPLERFRRPVRGMGVDQYVAVVFSHDQGMPYRGAVHVRRLGFE